ncbi:hypothetical protein PMAYCL1PPCAC_28609, partial [Pristionchus mayeri]
MSREEGAHSLIVVEWLKGVPLGHGSARSGDHIQPLFLTRARRVCADYYLKDPLIRSHSIVIGHRHMQMHLLHLLRADIEGEALVVVWIESLHLDRRLLLLQSLIRHHQIDLHVRIC